MRDINKKLTNMLKKNSLRYTPKKVFEKGIQSYTTSDSTRSLVGKNRVATQVVRVLPPGVSIQPKGYPATWTDPNKPCGLCEGAVHIKTKLEDFTDSSDKEKINELQELGWDDESIVAFLIQKHQNKEEELRGKTSKVMLWSQSTSENPTENIEEDPIIYAKYSADEIAKMLKDLGLPEKDIVPYMHHLKVISDNLHNKLRSPDSNSFYTALPQSKLRESLIELDLSEEEIVKQLQQLIDESNGLVIPKPSTEPKVSSEAFSEISEELQEKLNVATVGLREQMDRMYDMYTKKGDQAYETTYITFTQEQIHKMLMNEGLNENEITIFMREAGKAAKKARESAELQDMKRLEELKKQSEAEIDQKLQDMATELSLDKSAKIKIPEMRELYMLKNGGCDTGFDLKLERLMYLAEEKEKQKAAELEAQKTAELDELSKQIWAKKHEENWVCRGLDGTDLKFGATDLEEKLYQLLRMDPRWAPAMVQERNVPKQEVAKVYEDSSVNSYYGHDMGEGSDLWKSLHNPDYLYKKYWEEVLNVTQTSFEAPQVCDVPEVSSEEPQVCGVPGISSEAPQVCIPAAPGRPQTCAITEKAQNPFVDNRDADTVLYMSQPRDAFREILAKDCTDELTLELLFANYLANSEAIQQKLGVKDDNAIYTKYTVAESRERAKQMNLSDVQTEVFLQHTQLISDTLEGKTDWKTRDYIFMENGFTEDHARGFFKYLNWSPEEIEAYILKDREDCLGLGISLEDAEKYVDSELGYKYRIVSMDWVKSALRVMDTPPHYVDLRIADLVAHSDEIRAKLISQTPTFDENTHAIFTRTCFGDQSLTNVFLDAGFSKGLVNKYLKDAQNILETDTKDFVLAANTSEVGLISYSSVLGGLSLYFVVVAFIISFVYLIPEYFAPKVDELEKDSMYECGFEPFVEENDVIESHFVLIGVLFVLFDLELILLVPLSAYIGLVGFLCVGLVFTFGVILNIALAYEWVSGILNWPTFAWDAKQKPEKTNIKHD